MLPKGFNIFKKSEKTLFNELLELKKEYIKETSKQKKDKSVINVLFKKISDVEEKFIDTNKGLFLGTAVSLLDDSRKKFPLYLEWANLNNHVGFQGTTRVGKTRVMAYLIRQCIEKGDNVIVIDPKGGENQELLSWTAQFCKHAKRSSDFMYISPVYIDLSTPLNPLFLRTNEQIASDCVMLVDGPNVEDFYKGIAYQIGYAISSCLEYLQYATDPSGELSKIQEEMEYIKYIQYMDKKIDNIDDDIKIHQEYILNKDSIDKIHTKYSNIKIPKEKLEFLKAFNRSLMTFDELNHYCDFKMLKELKILLETIPTPDRALWQQGVNIDKIKTNSLKAINSVLSTEEEFLSKVSSSLKIKLMQLSTGKMGELFCGIRINPLMTRLMSNTKGCVCVIQPFPMTFQSISDMAVKIILSMLKSMFGYVGYSGNSLNKRLHIFIDEAGAVTYPDIKEFFNKAGGLGATMWVFTQSYADYKESMGDNQAEILMDNVNTSGIMRLNHANSCESAIEIIGNIRRQVTSTMLSGADSKYSSQIVEEPIASIRNILTLNNACGIIKHQKDILYVEFPIQKDIEGAFVMPSLTEDERRELQVSYENN